MIFSCLLGLVFEASAVPLQLTQQGRLLDSSGAAVTGSHYLHFSIHDGLMGGTQLWSETLLVNFNNGYYATVLGTDEQNNALDSDTLSQYPVYIEIQLDSNAPMSPRQAINSVPYAQISGVSESLEGGSINASQIWINNIPVIDGSGSWVGPTPSVTWSDVTGKPPGFADNADNDSLGGLSCSAGEIASWTGSGWGCASDNTVDVNSLGTMLSNNSYDLNTSTTLGGDGIVTTLTDQDSLGSLSCANDGEVAKYDIVTSSWYCAEAITESDVETYITNDPIDLEPNTTIDGQMIVRTPPNCPNGSLLSFDSLANSWSCIALADVLDQDSDGILSWVDCDDSDSTIRYLGEDASCPATTCLEILEANPNASSDEYWLSQNGGPAYQAYCDMETDGGGWTMCYTEIDSIVHIQTEINYTGNYGQDGYRSDCRYLPFTDVLYVNHSSNQTAWFTSQAGTSLTLAGLGYNAAGSAAGTLFSPHGVASTGYSYQLNVCDSNWMWVGIMMTGYTNCYKQCGSWCGDGSSPYFRTNGDNGNSYTGVAFNENGHTNVGNKLMSVGLR